MTHSTPLLAALQDLRLPAMAAALDAQAAAGDTRPFEERLAALLEACRTDRETRGLQHRFARAGLAVSSACLEEVRYGKGRGLRREVVDALAEGAWVRRAQHLLITGGAGRGKTWLACAFAVSALRQGHSVRFYDVPDLLAAWYAADAEGTLAKLRRDLDKTSLLVLDDWAVEPLQPTDVLTLRRILTGRYEQASVLVASPVAVKDWNAWLGGAYLADAMVERLAHAAHRIELKGPSLR